MVVDVRTGASRTSLRGVVASSGRGDINVCEIDNSISLVIGLLPLATRVAKLESIRLAITITVECAQERSPRIFGRSVITSELIVSKRDGTIIRSSAALGTLTHGRVGNVTEFLIVHVVSIGEQITEL